MKSIFQDKRNIVIFVIGAICLVTAIAGVAYAYIAYNVRQTEINIIETGCVRIEMEELSSAIYLPTAYPMTDEAGAKTEPFTFKVTNVCNGAVNYNVNLEVAEIDNRVDSKNIATKFDENSKSILSTNPIAKISENDDDDTIIVEAYNLYTGTLKNGESVIHNVRIWLDYDAGNETQNGKFYSRVAIEAVQSEIAEVYQESILNGADPVLADNLVPVIIDNAGTVTKADISTEWYKYENKVWANAVILVDDSIEYNANDVIPESNIESYFVWIPKYSYQIWDLGDYTSTSSAIAAEKVINIKFGLNNTSDSNSNECTTPLASKESGACAIGDYMTHPAFLAFGTNGLWVGKFETGYKGATSTTSAQSNSNDRSKVEIKPNVYSWRGIQASNAYLTSYNYQRSLDSHMMKNTEWGAVAYLQHSVYGSQNSVRFNNNSAYITGYAAVSEPTCGYTGTNTDCNKYEATSLGADGTSTINYFNTSSVLASTTGNYSGIYDMSGGAWELMMAVMIGGNGTLMSGDSLTYNSGFSGLNRDGTTTVGIDFPDDKYFDKYVYGTNYMGYDRRILGDATGEMGPFEYLSSGTLIGSWYSDEGWFILPSTPWFKRGNDVTGGNGAGVFSFIYNYGSSGVNDSFRIVLAI